MHLDTDMSLSIGMRMSANTCVQGQANRWAFIVIVRMHIVVG